MRGSSIRIGLALAVAGFVQSLPNRAEGSSLTLPFTTPIPATSTEFTNQSIEIPQFDPSLGILQAVEISYSSVVTATMTVTKSGIKPASGSVYTNVELDLTDASGKISQIDNVSTTPVGFSLTTGTMTTVSSSSPMPAVPSISIYSDPADPE